MSWIYLILAISMEVLGTTFMKLSEGLTKLPFTIGMFAAYIICFSFLSLSLKTIDMSVAYAIWSALGIVLISLIGIIYFGEHLNYIKVISTVFIIIGVIGLKLSSSH